MRACICGYPHVVFVYVCALSFMTPVYRVCLTIERPTLGGISRIQLYVAFESDVLDVGLANLVDQSTNDL